MASGLGSSVLRCVRLSNLVCHRWQRHKFHNLGYEQISAFQYSTFKRFVDPPSLNGEKPKKKKTERIPKITLHLENDKIAIIELENAVKLAKRRMLLLQKIADNDPKTHRPVYQLVAKTDAAEDSVELEEVYDVKRSTKLIAISDKISAHDFDIKINKVKTLLQKRFRCKIVKACASEDIEKTKELLKTTVNGLGEIINTKTTKTSVTITIEPVKAIDKAEIPSATASDVQEKK